MKITQFLLSGIIAFVTITCYLLFLAQRDTKMMNYYDSTIGENIRFKSDAIKQTYVTN